MLEDFFFGSRPYFRWLEVIDSLDEIRAKVYNDDDVSVLNEFNIKNSRLNPATFLGVDQKNGKYIYKNNVSDVSLLYDKHHIESKCDTRFPTDPKIANMIIPDNVENYLEHMDYIFHSIYNFYRSKITIIINRFQFQFPKGIENVPTYNDTSDESFKFALYTNFQYKDKFRMRYFQIESAIPIEMSFFTLGNKPLANMPFELWISESKKEFIVRELANKMKVVCNYLETYKTNHNGEELITSKDLFDPNKVKLIPHPDIVKKPFLLLSGYTTWIKEVRQDGSYIEGNSFNKMCGTPDNDVYCWFNNKPAFVFRSEFKILKNPVIDDDLYERLVEFESSRAKNTEYIINNK